MIKTAAYCLLISFACTLIGLPSYAQKKDAVIKDTAAARIDFVTKMQLFAKAEAKKSADEFNADKAVIAQNKILEEIKKTIQKAKIYLKTGVDTVGIKAQLALIIKDYEVAGDGVFTNKGTAQTFRNLTATSKILTELLNKATARKARLDLHHHTLSTFRYELDSLSSIPSLFKFPTDSAVLTKYLQQLVVVAYEVHPVDSALKQANGNIQTLLNKVNLEVFKLQTRLEEIELYQRQMAGNTFKREFDNIWGRVGYYRPFDQILSQAKAKAILTLSFYVQNNSGKLIIMALLVIVAFIYLRSLKSIYIENKLLDASFEGQLVLRYPLLSAILIVVNLFQFVFFSPPFILSVIIWAIGCICLTILFKNFITKYWINVWLIMVALFMAATIDNLILQATRVERWVMLIISISGVIVGTLVILKGRINELREKWILISIGFMAVLEVFSALANILGRYNLSKALMIAGFLNVIISILFLWTVRLINEGLFLAFNVYRQQDRKLFYLNFDKVGKKAPALFYVLLVIGWMVLFGRNFAGFEFIAKPLREFFSRERTLGDYTFSINTLVLFIVIMAVSVIISKVVSYFASDKHLSSDKDRDGKGGVGSWLLLIRITILSIGLFLAIAAAGIPMDRITIVLGALGVGIGFGLQTLVNNLVSGLIIAFEKPVNVGDIVDVDGQGGTMKSIGFRSSVIATWDGADVVMPNGDLLNSHLTNWSLGGNRKRMSVMVGVAYNSDLEKTKQILNEILNADDRISKHKGPVVQYEQFNNSAIDIKIQFWPKNINEAHAIRSDIIMAITTAFRVNGIVIPYPQQDVYYHHPDKTNEGDGISGV
ncbi:MAG: mechanosensitive ion channel domain-containing protein [Mucilaginibacter sp.]|jgi:small-conductance mechanosensitive channel|uniref:mechanosensitive ion channel family protein n=1 Tax=Mucilaginibacter sp. TaxID=1882438 RepID=UPI0035614A98